ncbi:ATP-binding protein [Kitasatospora sp. NPDC085895]|uniref:ATP-binding protein n=1 Tax=Kitasatospora sp. NPDC085895 TaxID=3155057 RepID=UPI00344B312A
MNDPTTHQPHPHVGGRGEALRALAAWHAAGPSAPRVVLLTGRPGSGRSRLLTGFLMLCDPVSRERIDLGALDPATVPAAELPPPAVCDPDGLTAAQLLWTAADVLGLDVDRTEDLLHRLAEERTTATALVVPDVDRAGPLRALREPGRVAAEVLLPLALSPWVRMLADVPKEQAAWLAERIPAGQLQVIDLDEAPWADPQALVRQAEYMLDRPALAADLAARAAGPLVVRLAAWSLRAAPDDGPVELPAGIGDVLDQHAGRCGADELTLRRLLAPLALAGDGAAVPFLLWAPLASAVAGRDLSKAFADSQALLLPFFELVGERDDPAVRLVHPEIGAELRERFGSTVREAQRRIAAVLANGLPAGPGRWEHAAPYVREHLTGHALEAGTLPELLADPGFLVHAGQVRLRAAVEHLAAAGTELPPLARTWLRLAPLFTRTEAGPLLRAALLEHACRQDGLPAPDLGPGLPWRTLWARPLPGVTALTAATAPDGTTVVAARVAGAEPGLAVHAVPTGEPVGVPAEQLTPLTEEQRAACPVRLGIGGDYVRLWPREEGDPVGVFLSAGPLGGADVTPDGVLLLADAAGLSALRLTPSAPV